MREPSITTLFTEEPADIRFEDLPSSFTEKIIIWEIEICFSMKHLGVLTLKNSFWKRWFLRRRENQQEYREKLEQGQTHSS